MATNHIGEMHDFLKNNNITLKLTTHPYNDLINAIFMSKENDYLYEFNVHCGNEAIDKGSDIVKFNNYVNTLDKIDEFDNVIQKVNENLQSISNLDKSTKFLTFLEIFDIELKIITRPNFGTIVGEFNRLDGENIYAVTVETGIEGIDLFSDPVKIDKFINSLINNNILDETMDEICRRLPDKIRNDDDRWKRFEETAKSRIDAGKDDVHTKDDKPKDEFTVREMTLDEAKSCIMGEREQDYGSPENNFATIGEFWSTYLGIDISAQQVADMMILMKISRNKNGGGTGDSYVDIAGYAACGNEIRMNKKNGGK